MAFTPSVLDFPRHPPTLADRVAPGAEELASLQVQLRHLSRQRLRDTLLLFFAHALLQPTRWSRSHPELYLIAFWVLPAVAGGLCFLGLCELTMQVTFATVAGWMVAAGTIAFLFAIRFLNLNALELWVASQRDRLRSLHKEDQNRRRQRADLQAAIHAQKQRPEQALDSANQHRAALLQPPWQELRGTAFADYLTEVLSARGAAVETVNTHGEPGVTLIATFGQRRVAIHAPHNTGPAGVLAIQQALAAAERHNCPACAVITTNRSTQVAIELAKLHHCTLVDEANFAQLVLGKIAL